METLRGMQMEMRIMDVLSGQESNVIHGGQKGLQQYHGRNIALLQ